MSNNFQKATSKLLIAFCISLASGLYGFAEEKPINLDETRIGMTKVITSGVSFNQQIASSSIDNSTAAKARGGQFWITKSGRYFLSTDVVANPVVNDIPVILIDTSDVLIDLGGKTLSLTCTSVNTQIVGIKVSPGLRNITICNGTISGSNSPTIINPTLVQDPSDLQTLHPAVEKPFYEGIVIGQDSSSGALPCANILLDSVIITSCAQKGIEIQNCQNIKMSNVTVQGVTTIPSVPKPAGVFQKICMQMNECKDVEVTDCDFNGATLTATEGVDAASAGDFAIGVYMRNCRNVYFRNVSASDNGADNSLGSGIGVWMEAVTSSKFENLRAVGNYTTSVDAGESKAGGLYLTTNDDNLPCLGNNFINCFLNDNSAADLSYTCTGFGVLVDSLCDNNLFMGCTAANNSGIMGAGFLVNSSRNTTFKDCIALGNYSKSPHGFAQTRGFSSINGTGNSYIRCEARGNTVDSVLTAGAGDAVAHPTEVPSAYGFYFDTENYSGIRECLSASNYGSLSNHAAYGIAFAGTCYSCVVSFSEMSANRAAYRYGFKDFAADCTTLLRGNISFAHGNCFKGGQSSIYDTGTLNYMLQYVDQNGNMDVQNLIKEADIANMNAFEAGSTKWFNFSILELSIAGVN